MFLISVNACCFVKPELPSGSDKSENSISGTSVVTFESSTETRRTTLHGSPELTL